MHAFSFILSPIVQAVFAGIVAAQEEDMGSLPTAEDTPVLPPDYPDFANPAEEVEIQKRTPPAGVYVCDQTNWQGKCDWIALKDMACMDFPWDAGTSVGPPNGWQCKFYYGAQCTGEMTNGKLTYPGTSNLGALYNNRLKPLGMKCRQCPSAPCINNNSPDFGEAILKTGTKDADGKCRYFEEGKVKTRPC
ncbi:uncharacterized protein Z518_10989 [Rhinocladiella mackenziei CBS 650.93]|uniref:Secreted protein n=1 Tax=Rhinocladiella mackenziei CBS 650.93 TaxID=1442369 RepID=A0A0D2FDA4_9EURO|nr:uncharacterized protein Z518_10989 [Rhinocladiella mackenziei CBS 650.93]KIX00062.1 hypothetical protein Z518_10989 [Rhinocladiella mackenziei CBS 650.93]